MAGEQRESTFTFHAQADELKEVEALLDSIGAKMGAMSSGSPGGGQTGPSTFSAMGSNVFGSGGVRDNPRSVGGAGTALAPINAAGSGPLGTAGAGHLSVGVINITATTVNLVASSVNFIGGGGTGQGGAGGGGGGTGGGGGAAGFGDFQQAFLRNPTPQGLMAATMGRMAPPWAAAVSVGTEMAAMGATAYYAGTRPGFELEMQFQRAAAGGEYIAPSQRATQRMAADAEGGLAAARAWGRPLAMIGMDWVNEGEYRRIERIVNERRGWALRDQLRGEFHRLGIPLPMGVEETARFGLSAASPMAIFGSEATRAAYNPIGEDWKKLAKIGYQRADVEATNAILARIAQEPGREYMASAFSRGVGGENDLDAMRELILRGDLSSILRMGVRFGQSTVNDLLGQAIGLSTTRRGLSTRAAMLRSRAIMPQTEAQFFGTPQQIYEATQLNIAPLRLQGQEIAAQMPFMNSFQQAQGAEQIVQILSEIRTIEIESQRHLASMNTSIAAAGAGVAATQVERGLMMGGGGIGMFQAGLGSAGARMGIVTGLQQELQLLTPGSAAYAAKQAELETARTSAVSAYHAVPLGMLPAEQRVEQMQAEFHLARQQRSWTEPGAMIDTQLKLNAFTQRRLQLLDDEEAAAKANGMWDPGQMERFAVERAQLQQEMWTRNLSITEGFLDRLPMRSSSPPSFAARLKPSAAEAAAALERHGAPGQRQARALGFVSARGIQEEMERGATPAGRSMSQIFPGDVGWAGGTGERFGRRGAPAKTAGGADAVSALMGMDGGDSAMLRDIRDAIRALVDLARAGQLMRPGGGPTPTGGFTTGANVVTGSVGQQANDVGGNR